MAPARSRGLSPGRIDDRNRSTACPNLSSRPRRSQKARRRRKPKDAGINPGMSDLPPAHSLHRQRGHTSRCAMTERVVARMEIVHVPEREPLFTVHPRGHTRQREGDGSCFDHLSSCLSQSYCWRPPRIRRQRRGYASGGSFTTAEADFTKTESTHKQVPCGPGERSRQTHMGQGPPPICIRPAIRFIANTPLATRAGVVSSVVVRAIPSKKP